MHANRRPSGRFKPGCPNISEIESSRHEQGNSQIVSLGNQLFVVFDDIIHDGGQLVPRLVGRESDGVQRTFEPFQMIVEAKRPMRDRADHFRHRCAQHDAHIEH